MSTGSTPEVTDRLAGVLTGPLGALGLDLEGIDLSKAGKRSVLRVAVDQDGGVSMDDIAEATKVVSEILDDSDLMGNNAFTLEVSSPGVDRPLTLPRHWRRNETRLVKVSLAEGDPVEGRIVSSDEDGVTLDVAGAPDGTVRIAYDAITKAKIQIEFKREG